MGKVMAVCISEKRGTQKKSVKEAILIEDFGIEDDAHAGDWHRQVSDCIMPREGVFTKVIKGGKISVGDEFVIK